MKTIACALGVMLVAATGTAPATALDITFDSEEGAGNPTVPGLETGAYRFSGDHLQVIGEPGSTYVSNGSAAYLAQTGAGAGGIILTRTDATPFVLYEFDAAGPFETPPAGTPNSQRLDLIGARAGGGVLSAFYELSGISGFAHFVVPGSWSGLASVTFAGIFSDITPAALALDDVGVGLGPGSAVPEPGSLLLTLTTTLGVGGLMLRRRLGRAARRR